MDTILSLLTGPAIGLAVIAAILMFLAITFRVVVPTNAVHIAQAAKKTTLYGKDQPGGNVYYRWPTWVPMIGIRVIDLPTAVFNLQLNGYAAYDKGRVPFELDIMAFFRMVAPDVTALRVASIKELLVQLEGILKGAARSLLAAAEIEEILEGRSKFGEEFTKLVDHQLSEFGLATVKNIEFMDIRDTQGSQVIANIMAKKQSLIEKESRVEVATNKKVAKLAEVAAAQEVQVREQEAAELVGIRSAQKDQQIGITQQKAAQAVKEEERTTTEKAMAVKRVTQVQQANIDQEVLVVATEAQRKKQIIEAEAQKGQAVIRAEGEKQQTIVLAEGAKQHQVLEAEGTLEAAKREAEGTQAKGLAKAAAETAILLAPVTAQTTLAKEIGANPGYQNYLISLRQIEAAQAVGVKQAEALTHADVKVIANSGSPADGIKSLSEMFSSKGGIQIGALLEGLKNTDVGKAVIEKVVGSVDTGAHPGESETFQNAKRLITG